MEPDFAMDYTDTLFSTFNPMFPDPREICNYITYIVALALLHGDSIFF